MPRVRVTKSLNFYLYNGNILFAIKEKTYLFCYNSKWVSNEPKQITAMPTRQSSMVLLKKTNSSVSELVPLVKCIITHNSSLVMIKLLFSRASKEIKQHVRSQMAREVPLLQKLECELF